MRYIRLTDALKQEALEKFQKLLGDEKFRDSKIEFSFDLRNTEELKNKITLNFTMKAWLKMWTLVQTESGEVGWHGTVDRISDTEFIVTDILIYPQFVTGVTVETDDVGYGNWLHRELDDDTFNHLRFHGHSHVNMSTTPSGVDTTWYNEILQGLVGDDFYLFMILNKREDYFIELYDLKTNNIYEKADIVINVMLDDNTYLKDWAIQEKEKALQEKHKIGFSTSSTIHNDSERQSFVDLLLSLTEEDLKDKGLLKSILEQLSQTGAFNGYYLVGYTNWVKATDIEKIRIAQTYYDTPVKQKQKQYKNNKKKYSTTKSIMDEWRDLYDFDY